MQKKLLSEGKPMHNGARSFPERVQIPRKKENERSLCCNFTKLTAKLSHGAASRTSYSGTMKVCPGPQFITLQSSRENDAYSIEETRRLDDADLTS